MCTLYPVSGCAYLCCYFPAAMRLVQALSPHPRVRRWCRSSRFKQRQMTEPAPSLAGQMGVTASPPAPAASSPAPRCLSVSKEAKTVPDPCLGLPALCPRAPAARDRAGSPPAAPLQEHPRPRTRLALGHRATAGRWRHGGSPPALRRTGGRDRTRRAGDKRALRGPSPQTPRAAAQPRPARSPHASPAALRLPRPAPSLRHHRAP